MNEDHIPFEEIQRYLMGEMEALERADFERRMAVDPDLAAAVELERELQMLVRYQRRLELKEMLRTTPTQGTDEDAPVQTETPILPLRKKGGIIRPPFWTLVTVISVAALVLIAIFVVKNFTSQPAYDQLFEEYTEEVYDEYDQSRATHKLRPGYREYDEGNWESAFNLLENTLQDTEALLMHGIAAMKLERWDVAEDELILVERMNDEQYSIYATWFLAMLDLREGRVKASKKRLKLVKEKKDINHLWATELLEKLD